MPTQCRCRRRRRRRCGAEPSQACTCAPKTATQKIPAAARSLFAKRRTHPRKWQAVRRRLRCSQNAPVVRERSRNFPPALVRCRPYSHAAACCSLREGLQAWRHHPHCWTATLAQPTHLVRGNSAPQAGGIWLPRCLLRRDKVCRHLWWWACDPATSQQQYQQHQAQGLMPPPWAHRPSAAGVNWSTAERGLSPPHGKMTRRPTTGHSR